MTSYAKTVTHSLPSCPDVTLITQIGNYVCHQP